MSGDLRSGSGYLETPVEDLELDPREEVCPDCHLVRWRPAGPCSVGCVNRPSAPASSSSVPPLTDKETSP